MKKCILKISILCFLSIIIVKNSYGQTVQNDSTYLQSAVSQTVANFNKSIDQQSRLFRGREYQTYDHTIKGNALYPLNIDTWLPGQVNYDGIVYDNVPMMYDIYRDVVVVLLYNKFSRYALLDEKVYEFNLADHHFVRIVTDSLEKQSSGMSTGFYDQLYGGNDVEVLAKRIKTIQSSANTAASLETFFTDKNEYYVKKGKLYYSVSGQSSFLKVFKDKKADLQQYIKNNNIKFKKDPEQAMVKIASYYDHLTN